jgi:hypothetical protein
VCVRLFVCVCLFVCLFVCLCVSESVSDRHKLQEWNM